MGAAVSLATAPIYAASSAAATCCGSIIGSCAGTAICKVCSCYCVAPPKVASALYFFVLMIFTIIAISMRLYGGAITIGFGYNATEASMIGHITHSSTQGIYDYWNSHQPCKDAYPSDFILCCANNCSGVFAVYRCSFALCLFFAFLTLCTMGTSRFGARAHRGFWVMKFATLFGLLIASAYANNEAMAAYREVARYTSFIFLVVQTLLLIDFAYRTNEYLVDLDEHSDSDSMCTWKLVLLGGAIVLYAISITIWVLSAQWFGMDGCGMQQTVIALTIIVTIALSIVSISRIAPHGTLFTSAVVTAQTSYLLYSALASNPDASCNATAGSHATADILVGILVACVSMGAFAWSATSSKDAIIGKSSTSTSELQVSLDAGAGSETRADNEEEAVGAESWWYYHLMMVLVSMYFAMLLSDWSVQPVDSPPQTTAFSKSVESFVVKLSSQWVCLIMYAWTLLAPYLLRDVRDFGIEFDF